MKMNLNYIQRRRVFKNSLVLATTLATSLALYANDSEVKIDSSGSAGQAQSEQGNNASLDAEARIDSKSNSSVESSGAPGQSQSDKQHSDKQHGDKATKFIKETSDTTTIIDIETEDRIGLLYYISNSFADLGIDIALAKILTEKGAARDTFYVTTSDGKKIGDPELQKLIERTLLEAIQRLDPPASKI